MKKFLQAGWIFLVLCFLLAGCSDKEQAKGTPQKKENNEQTVKKGTPEWTMQEIKKAVAMEDQELFMSYQNKENKTFYKEQKRWLEEAVYRKKQGYEISVELYSFHQENDTTGTVTFGVMMSDPKKQGTTNTVNYQMIKVKDKWVLNDVPFEKISDETGNLTVYYTKGQEEPAQQTLKDAADLVNFYAKQFNWKPKPISIKIYPSVKEISATVPWLSVAGWNEMGESFKFTTEQQQPNMFSYLAHELTHKMVGDLTNDNATPFIQEGLAMYLEGSVLRDASGTISIDAKLAEEQAALATQKSKTVKTIDKLGTLAVTDQDMTLYRDGFLLSNYLIESKGMPEFTKMLEYLSKNKYTDKRLEQKMETSQKRTLESLEKTYGPVDKLSEEFKNYYAN
ncbi:M1 family aminopeptidase [Neobacillus sp. Marseille-QA0830]